MKNLKTKFAVLVLSTICLLTGAFGQLTPTGDSYTSTATPTKNFGSATTLGVESSETTFIQFNLSSIPSGYTSADITKATLKLFVDGVTAAGSFNVDYVNGTWTESTIDASNAPALGTTIAASVPLVAADKNQYVLVDVTAAVQAWLSGTPNDGIALVANSPLNATFDSKEATKTSHPAELDIVFAGGGTITGVTTASGSGLTGGGTSGTLNLSLTHACAANQVLQYNGSAWTCAAVGTGTITGVTAGTDLTGGGTSGNVTLNLNTAATNALYAQLGAANTFSSSQTVNGTLTATAGLGNGVVGNGGSNGAGVFGNGAFAGVEGNSSTTTGFAFGVFGSSASSAGYGVYGANNATTGTATGVYGVTQSGAGYGVEGINNATSGFTGGVYGYSVSPDGSGVVGINNGNGIGDGQNIGVYGSSSSGTYGTGVYGTSYQGVFGETDSGTGVVGGALSGTGVYGFTGLSAVSISTAGAPYGVVGASPVVGVYGASYGASGYGPGIAGLVGVGLWGDTGGTGGAYAGVLGTADSGIGGAFSSNINYGGLFLSNTNYAGAFQNNNTNTSATIYATNQTFSAGGEVFEGYLASTGAEMVVGDPGCGSGFIALQLSQAGMSNCNNYTLTGGSNGETYLNTPAGKTVHLRVNNVDALRATNTGVAVVGTLSKGGGSFMIDHPLDPANKYLYHSFVESPDMMNIYNGVAELDGSGEAVIALPDWFQTLNKDFRYQLTTIGGYAPVYIAQEVANNHFKIAGGRPGIKVSWQVTGIRQDAFANANRIPVEVEKAAADRGRYLYPEAIGQPASARIGYEAPPPGSEHIVHQRPTFPRLSKASPAAERTPLKLRIPRRPNLPNVPPMPHVAPLPPVAPLHHPAQASKPEVNQK